MSKNANYYMSLSLNVLEHLGLNLYSSFPAVISEIVANAWDADATEVKITWNSDDQKIEIFDNGMGMTQEDINARFLRVGYKKRDQQKTTPKGRKPMGRKGIGKLSVFSIANTVQVYTCKGDEKHAFEMRMDESKKKLKTKIKINNTSPNQLMPQALTLIMAQKLYCLVFDLNIKKPIATLKPKLPGAFQLLAMTLTYL